MKKEENSDKKLWKDFREGKDYALSHIYSQHVQLLFHYGRKFSGDTDLIKDTIQDLFFDLIRTRENLGDTDNIRFYLLVSFRRRLIQNLKKSPHYVDVAFDHVRVKEDLESSEDELIREEELTGRRKKIRGALKKLSAKQREILFYRFTCGFGYEEICELMALKYDSARKLNFRALKILRQYLTDTDTG